MFPSTSLIVFLAVVTLQGINTHELDTKDYPLDLSTLRHIRIHNYTGPIEASNFKFLENIETLEITSSNLQPWNDEVVNVLKYLRRFSLANSNVDRKIADVSGCCANLRAFELINNNISVISWKIIGSWSIDKLIFHKEPLPVLKANIFTSKTIKELTLEYCGTELVEDNSLLDLENLEILNLQGNKLKVFNTKAFEPLKSLRELNLGRNLLEKFTTEQLPHLPNLERINIAYNPIKEFNLDGIKTVAPKLQQVDISGIEDIDMTKPWEVPLIQSSVL